MNAKDGLALVRQFLEVLAPISGSKFDDWLLGLVKAIEASPEFIAVIQVVLDKLFKKPAVVGGTPAPETALPIEKLIDSNDPAWADAFNKSPALQVWAQEQKPEGMPAGAKPFGIGTVIAILSNLPTIIALLKALFAGNLGTVK